MHAEMPGSPSCMGKGKSETCAKDQVHIALAWYQEKQTKGVPVSYLQGVQNNCSNTIVYPEPLATRDKLEVS